MTAKEIFLELLKEDGKPERQLIQYEALQMALGDPVGGYLHMGRRPGATITDLWGTVIEWPADHPGSMPHVTQENKVIKDITRWRDYVHVPDIRANCSDESLWTGFREHMRELAGDERLVAAFMATGIFEQCHFLMPFQEVLTNLYDHPDEMHELIECITEFRIEYAKLLIDNLHPDAIFSHDDWGTKDALFMKPEMWREFFKEPYRRFYGYIRSRGVIAIHHADSYLAPIIDDMAEIGIQVWQGVLPENNIPALQRQLQGKMVLMGGIGAAIDRGDAGEEEVRAYVHDALEEYCPGGHFIPSITYGLAGTVYKHVDPWIDDEISLPAACTVLTFDDGKEGFLKYGVPVLEKHNIPATSFMIGWDKNNGADKVKQYASPLIDFESHTYAMHQKVEPLIDGHKGIMASMTKDEIKADLAKAAELTGTNDAIAYPYGDYTDDMLEAVKEQGITCAFTVEYDRVRKGMDPAKLPRVRVLGDESFQIWKESVY